MGKTVKGRYYVVTDGKRWLVCDRRKPMLQGDVVEVCASRRIARVRARELNQLETKGVAA